MTGRPRWAEGAALPLQAHTRPVRHLTASGARVYTLTVPILEMFTAHAYLYLDGAYAALIDTGTPLPQSLGALDAGLAAVRREWGEGVTWADLSRIVVTHAHFDHCGGLPWLLGRTAAPVAASRLTREVLEDPAGALADEEARMARFLAQAGADPALLGNLKRFPQGSVRGLTPVSVHTTLRGGDVLDSRFEVIEAAGHSSGQVCLRVDDLLLCADQVMTGTSPRLVPHSYEAGSGLRVYLDSLARLSALEGISLVLAGHDDPMDWPTFQARAAALTRSHLGRLGVVRDRCAEPLTTAQLAGGLYPGPSHPALALLQLQAVATWVEYQEERGELRREGEAAAQYVRVL
ncbi:MBL fold metallo-hydrolase [Deinococcus sp.]|uniref:MBL fold metallo-hydrolase n=1 Tax=Deinococcus sp. TaxID=47478 RepID=UPI0025C0BEEB|nr:MBL fold metallo-hydrolase [Deinococcus sp.]